MSTLKIIGAEPKTNIAKLYTKRQQDCINVLEEHLRRAKAGEIEKLVVFSVDDRNVVSIHHVECDREEMIGAMTVAMHRMIAGSNWTSDDRSTPDPDADPVA